MAKRRTHSSIDLLPAALQGTLTAMIVDNTWPDDWLGSKDGNPTYADLVHFCKLQGHNVSESAMGRFGKRMSMLARMKQAGVIVRDVMSGLNAENASQTQKAVAEMITAQTIEFITSTEDMNSKQIKDISTAIRDCTQVSITADKYSHNQQQAKVEKAAKSIDRIAKKKNIDPETLKIIREQIYGIVS